MEDGTRVEDQQTKTEPDPSTQVRVSFEDTLMRSGERMAQWFKYSHLPERLQAVSKRYAQMAIELIANIPANPERTVALRKLLESKDCAVRAVLEATVEEAPRAGSVR